MTEREFIKIEDLKPGMKRVYIEEVEVIEAEETETEVNGKKHSIVNGRIRDDTGEVNIVAWDFPSQFLKEGSKVKIWNCYCKDLRNKEDIEGNMEVTTGKFGKIFKLD